MLGDWPITGDRIDTAIYSDVEEDIFEIEKNFPDQHSPVRKVDQLVVELGDKEGVKTHIVPAPLICQFQYSLTQNHSSAPAHPSQLVLERDSLLWASVKCT